MPKLEVKFERSREKETLEGFQVLTVHLVEFPLCLILEGFAWVLPLGVVFGSGQKPWFLSAFRKVLIRSSLISYAA